MFIDIVRPIEPMALEDKGLGVCSHRGQGKKASVRPGVGDRAKVKTKATPPPAPSGVLPPAKAY